MTTAATPSEQSLIVAAKITAAATQEVSCWNTSIVAAVAQVVAAATKTNPAATQTKPAATQVVKLLRKGNYTSSTCTGSSCILAATSCISAGTTCVAAAPSCFSQLARKRRHNNVMQKTMITFWQSVNHYVGHYVCCRAVITACLVKALDLRQPLGWSQLLSLSEVPYVVFNSLKEEGEENVGSTNY